jgi:hypothetical protein
LSNNNKDYILNKLESCVIWLINKIQSEFNLIATI